MNAQFGQSLPGFQYPLVRTTPAEALQRWLALRQKGAGVFTPVILDSPANYALSPGEFSAAQEQIAETLETSKAILLEEFFRSRSLADAERFAAAEAVDWPAKPWRIESALLPEGTDVYIVKVPTANSFEAIAHLGFGGWNDCPGDEEHVAVLRYWHARYDAALFAQGPDLLECRVANPPTTREDALRLAREQYAYAPGTLGEFGVPDSIPDLAAALLNSPHWVFWWD